MRKKQFFYLAVFTLLIIRVLVLDVNFAGWLSSIHFDSAARIVGNLKSNAHFLRVMGDWMLPVFVFTVLIYWLTEEGDARVTRQFWLLPIVYALFVVLVEILLTGAFNLDVLSSLAMVILPWGYLYVIVWVAIIWILEKIGIAKHR